MAITRVWTGLDALVNIYYVDKDGTRRNKNGAPWVPDDGPLVNYCYFQNITLDGNVPFARRPVTGRPFKKIVADIDEWELSVEHFYIGLSKEFDPLTLFGQAWEIGPIIGQVKLFELVLTLQAPENLIDNEPHTLVPAKRTASSIAGRENDVIVGTAKFAAEQFK